MSSAVAERTRSSTGLVFNDRPRKHFWWDEEAEPKRSIVQERRRRQQRLAITFRLFARHGFDVGLAGHVTVRDPELTDLFWINPLGLHFGRIRVSDLLLVNRDGEIVIGDGPLNQASFAIHAAMLAEAAGTPQPIPHEIAELTHSQISGPNGARRAFESLARGLVEAEPEVPA